MNSCSFFMSCKFLNFFFKSEGQFFWVEYFWVAVVCFCFCFFQHLKYIMLLLSSLQSFCWKIYWLSCWGFLICNKLFLRFFPCLYFWQLIISIWSSLDFLNLLVYFFPMVRKTIIYSNNLSAPFFLSCLWDLCNASICLLADVP